MKFLTMVILKGKKQEGQRIIQFGKVCYNKVLLYYSILAHMKQKQWETREAITFACSFRYITSFDFHSCVCRKGKYYLSHILKMS